MLEGLVDIYLPDIKYFINEPGVTFSAAANYFHFASRAVMEMYRQVGEPVFDQEGLMKRGLLIRHLILPGLLRNTKRILSWISENLHKGVYVSLMGQYTPVYRAKEFESLNRTITGREYDEAIEYFFSIGLENGFVQELESADDSFIPDFSSPD
jgi:putative pyruvate formate lyase activating enzyme